MSMDSVVTWELCKDAARSIYGKTAPNARYADVVARLLFGTAAQESGLRWRRQRSCSWGGPVGGFSLWQVEYRASVVPSLVYLQRRQDVLAKATAWLWQDPHATDAWAKLDEADFLWLLRGWDRMGCLFARLHYLRVQEAVPSGLEAQAAYWKRFFNTSAGKGTVGQYVDNWWEFCEGVVRMDNAA